MIGDDVNTIALSFEEYPWVEVSIVVYQGSITTLIPFSLVFVANILILRGVHIAAYQRRNLGETKKTGDAENKNLTRMLLLVSFAFLICCAPYMLYEVTFLIPAINSIYIDTDIYWLLREGVIMWTTGMITQMNHAVNFYLYVLGGGKKFQTDAKNVLSILRCK
jgi:hypothetical protein